jgi:hypothetical protein
MAARIMLRHATAYERDTYQIRYRSVTVHKVSGVLNHRFPHTLTIWDNTSRPNPHPGETHWTVTGPVGGDGRYLDPTSHATDSPMSALLAAEPVVIDGRGRAYGDPVSDGDTVVVMYPDGSAASFRVDGLRLHPAS